jgi:hypothetical protein
LSFVLARDAITVTLPIVNDLSDGGDCNIELFDQDRVKPIIIIKNDTVQTLTLQGYFWVTNQNNSDLETNYLAGLRAIKGKEVTLTSLDGQYDGSWVLKSYVFRRIAEGQLTRYAFTVVLLQGDDVIEL